MVTFTTTLAALSAIFATALAAPTQGDAVNSLEARDNTGSITYFNPGLGACGQTNGDNDAIVAVSAALYDSQHPCNRNIRVSYHGRSVVVKVVDRCTGCAFNDLDLSPSAFRQVIGDLGIGRATATWAWA
ncbi:Papain inhibitor [Tolypocladium ophioglossoides CBS 100239]|uniref:Papain inhibitor n=1 Tax=Tolypocladium ophioglossoides (strain CBS 100239) TaxID=1163406 RepID=A0A0L0N4Y0_TOLOC|nr:Papain inhibitor [Tolypocladium ophioglossoides CBS 100239]